MFAKTISPLSISFPIAEGRTWHCCYTPEAEVTLGRFDSLWVWKSERTGIYSCCTPVSAKSSRSVVRVLWQGCNSARASSSTRLGSGAVRESNSMSRDNSVQTPTAFRDYFLNCRSWGKIMGQIVCLCSSSQLQQSYRRRYSDCSQSVPSFTCSNSMRIAEKNAWGFYKYILNSCLCVFSLLHLQAMLGCVFQLHLQKKKTTLHVFLHRNDSPLTHISKK